MKDDDIYQQPTSYSSSAHRIIALATQASMIFVSSFYTPNLLNGKMTRMREIVDKHFLDNYIIPIYQGYLIDLTQYLSQFEALKKTLNNNVNEVIVSKIEYNYQVKVKSLIKEGKLLDDYVLGNVVSLLEFLREWNITIRWLLLHSNCRDKASRANV